MSPMVLAIRPNQVSDSPARSRRSTPTLGPARAVPREARVIRPAVEWPLARVCSADQAQVQPRHVGVIADRPRRGGRDQADIGLRLGQRGQDVQPRLSPALVGEQRGHLRCRPQVAVDPRVRGVGAAHDAAGPQCGHWHGRGSWPGGREAAYRAQCGAHLVEVRSPRHHRRLAIHLDVPFQQAALGQHPLARGTAGPGPRAQVDSPRLLAIEMLHGTAPTGHSR